MAIHTLKFTSANHRGEYDQTSLSIGDASSTLSEIHIVPNMDTYEAGLQFANEGPINEGDSYIKLGPSLRSSFPFGFDGQHYFDVARRFNILVLGSVEVHDPANSEANIGKPLVSGSITAFKARRNMIVLTVPINLQRDRFMIEYQ